MNVVVLCSPLSVDSVDSSVELDSDTDTDTDTDPIDPSSCDRGLDTGDVGSDTDPGQNGQRAIAGGSNVRK